MKFSVSREDLLKQLQLVAGVVERRQTLPILSNVLIKFDGSQLAVVGTDLEVEIVSQSTLDAGDGVAGEVTAPARKLLDICRSLPEEAKINLSTKEARLAITSGRSRFSLSTLPANEFPSVDKGPGNLEFKCPASGLKHLIDSTAFAMAHQDVRYYLNGMLWEATNEQLRAVATDGHRLAMTSLAVPVQAENKIQAIIPRKGVLELSRLLGDEDQVTVSLGSNHVHISGQAFVFTSKLVDAAYPDYDRVLPKGGDKKISGDRAALKQAFSRAAILSNEKYRGVRLALAKNFLLISATNPEQEEAEEQVEVDYEGEEFEIGFNVNYVLDVLNTLDGDEALFTLSDANSSGLVEGSSNRDSVYVIMPMRL